MVKNLRSAALIVAIYGALHVAGIHTADTQLRRTSLTGTASPPSKGAHAYTSLEPLVFSSLARGLWTLYWLFEHLIAEISSAVTWPFLSYRRFKEKMQSDSSPEPPPWEDFEYPVESLNDDHVVPSWKYESMKDAIEQARSGQRIYARKGDHHWDAKITLQGPHDTRGKIRWMHVIGEYDARLWGRWSISINTGGSFKGLKCAYETEGVSWPCVLVRGNPWMFETCQIRCAGAYAMMCAKSSRVTVRRCGVGGMGGGARRAVCCVMIMDSSWCCLQNSQIDETEYQSPGIRLIENGKAVIESCVFQRNGYGIAVDNNAKVKVRGCILKENNHAAFYAGWDASNSEIDIRQCAVYGRVWHSSDRPGKLSECDNRFTVSSMTQSSMIVDPELAADATSEEDKDDLSWRYGRTPGRKGFTAPGSELGSLRERMVSRRMSFPDLRGLEMHTKSSKAAEEGGGQEEETVSRKRGTSRDSQRSDLTPRWISAKSFIGRSRSIAEITSGTYEETMQTRSSSTQT